MDSNPCFFFVSFVFVGLTFRFGFLMNEIFGSERECRIGEEERMRKRVRKRMCRFDE